MKSNYLYLFIFLLLPTAFIIAAEPKGFNESFHKPVDSWINDEIDTIKFLEEIKQLKIILENKTNSWENLYWRSRIALLRGQVYYENKEKKKSIRELENCHELLDKSIQMMDFSDSWRIKAEASSLIMIQKGIFYIIANFKKGQNEAKRSLELDPDNARASMVIAQFLVNAPKIAGGNIDQGIELLEQNLTQTDLIKEDRFFLLLSLGEALKKDNQPDKASERYQQALKIYPGYDKGLDLVGDLTEEK